MHKNWGKKTALSAFLPALDFGKQRRFTALDLTDKTHSFRIPRFILATVSVCLHHICIKILKHRAEGVNSGAKLRANPPQGYIPPILCIVTWKRRKGNGIKAF